MERQLSFLSANLFWPIGSACAAARPHLPPRAHSPRQKARSWKNHPHVNPSPSNVLKRIRTYSSLFKPIQVGPPPLLLLQVSTPGVVPDRAKSWRGATTLSHRPLSQSIAFSILDTRTSPPYPPPSGPE